MQHFYGISKTKQVKHSVMNDSNAQTIVISKTKSSVPVITGAIGFMLGIPAVLCATICAGACATLATAPVAIAASDPSLAKDPDVIAGATATAAATGTLALPIIAFIISWILGFILCFFGKCEHSKLTGLLTIFCGVGMGIPSVIMFNILGITAAILYVISGGSAISNSGRPD